MSQEKVRSGSSDLPPLEEGDHESSSFEPLSPLKSMPPKIPKPQQLNLPFSDAGPSKKSPSSATGEGQPKIGGGTQQQQQQQKQISGSSSGGISSLTGSEASKPKTQFSKDRRRSSGFMGRKWSITSGDSSGTTSGSRQTTFFFGSSTTTADDGKNRKRRSSLFSREDSYFSSSNNSILASLNMDNSVPKRGSLARGNKKTLMMYNSRMAAAQIYRGYSIGDYALVMNECDSSSSPTNINEVPKDIEKDKKSNANQCLVNKYGYPKGKGKTQAERSGPYSYFLCTITKAHYEENEVYWTVVREDNDEEMRGEARNMARISSPEAVLAAEQAALLSRAIAEDHVMMDDPDENKKKLGFARFLSECCCITFCLPIVIIYGVVTWVKETKAYKTLMRHARMFLDGREPYKLSFRITSVKVIVLCSTWYLFIDQIRLAFLPPSSDNTIAWINFSVWLILVMELVLGVFVRPEGWHSLVRSDKAYTPHTAQYLNGVHLLVESISLLFFVPVFVCIFSSDKTCSDRISFSFLEASLAAVLGPSLASAFYGRFFYAVIRLRVFSLVRHWRNAWLHSVFVDTKKHAARERRRRAFLYGEDDMSTSTMGTSEEDEEGESSNQHLVPYGESSYLRNQRRMRNSQILREQEEKIREEARVKAANIGTALMTVNSHRAMFLFCFLTACFPMLFLFNKRNVVNGASSEMVDYLQAINVQDAFSYNGQDYSIDCDYLFQSVDAWSKAMVQFDPLAIVPRTERQDSDAQTEKALSTHLISVSIQPPRCYETFNNKTIGNLIFNVGENCPQWSWPDEEQTDGCIYGTLFNITESFDSLQEIAANLSVRVGTMKTFESQSQKAGNSTFAVSATINHTHVVKSGAQNSFWLELFLFVFIIAMLQLLRTDTVNLVFGSLRSMLRIVLRYAKNPLSPAGGNEVQYSEGNARNTLANESGPPEPNEDGEDDEDFRTYETEQLVTAVTKITDLLRKCWGVAGADIISTNLASRDGDFEVFNPTVPGRNVFALFAFAAITDFDYALKNLDGDVMILINDVASVLHGEVYRWGLGDSGQCNRNLGAAFFMVFKIGSVMEVVEKLEEATQVVFSTTTGKRSGKKGTKRLGQKATPPSSTDMTTTSRHSKSSAYVKGLKSGLHAEKDVAMEAMAEAMQLSLEQIPGISTFADRAVIGMLKAFASIHRDTQLRAWSKDFRLNDPTGDTEKGWSVDMIFGMDAGWAIEGAVGSKYKIDATYLSPHVNMSSRMMSACKQYGVTILLSEAVHELLSEPGKNKMRNIDRVTVKGSSKVQNIYTYDARANGTYLFLYSVTDEQADQQAKNYTASIWNDDMDLKDMRHHITEDFEQEFKAGMKAYYAGDWPTAIEKLERANDIMVETAMEEGDLRDSMSASPEREELYKKEASDPPCMYILNFMKSKGGVAPADWDGWHPLMSK